MSPNVGIVRRQIPRFEEKWGCAERYSLLKPNVAQASKGKFVLRIDPKQIHVLQLGFVVISSDEKGFGASEPAVLPGLGRAPDAQSNQENQRRRSPQPRHGTKTD
jgi:hypothetical protein